MGGQISQGSQGTNLAQLISSISPILLGTGKTTGTTDSSGTNDTTVSSTTQKSADPGTLAALLGVAQNASNNAQNPDITNGIVNNIFQQSAEAFAPTAGLAASSGLYNSSTLGLLSDDARARATAQASAAVLNFQTQQQTIASGALSNILGATGSTTTNTTQKAATSNQGITTNITAPSLSGGSLLQSALGIGASVLGKKALDSATPFLKDSFNSITDSLGLTNSSGVGSLASSTQTGAAASDSAMSGVTAEGASTLPSSANAVGSSSTGLDISASPGAQFSTGADGLSSSAIDASVTPADVTVTDASGAVAPLSESATPEAGSAASINAPSVDVASSVPGADATPGVAATTPDITAAPDVAAADAATPGVGTSVNAAGADLTGGGLEGEVGAQAGADVATDGSVDVAGLAADTGGLGSITGADVAGGIVGDATGLATTDAAVTGFGEGAGDFAAGAAGLGGADLGAAGLGEAAIDAGAFDATFGGIAAGVGEGAADVAVGAGVAEAGVDVAAGAAAADSSAELIAALAAVAWVVCTELVRQGKIPTKIYRYALRRFNKYNYWGVKGYLTWGLPLKNYVRDNPDTKITAFIAWTFLARAHNLALREGCLNAKWSLVGWISSVVCYWISVVVGTYLGFKYSWQERRILAWKEIFRKWDNTNYMSDPIPRNLKKTMKVINRFKNAVI